ncbi:MAG: nitronate monooxygenase [Alphaproteobacteria bacterium]
MSLVSFQHLRLPVIAAPMFLVSGPELVIAASQAGIIGAFPALNARTTDEFEQWLRTINNSLPQLGSYAVNLIVHKSVPRTPDDLQVCIRHKVPIVITSLGAANEVVEAVHSYGGMVLHDVISEHHAEKAIAAGVDGLILVCAGAGGHAGTLNPFAFVATIRRMFKGMIILSGGITDGRGIAAARALGADFAYMGTRFMATAESRASAAHKQMILDCGMKDIVGTPAVSGVFGNFLRPSLEAAGINPSDIAHLPKLDLMNEHKAWRDIWSAGQGVGAITDIPSVSSLVERLHKEYMEAVGSLKPI